MEVVILIDPGDANKYNRNCSLKIEKTFGAGCDSRPAVKARERVLAHDSV